MLKDRILRAKELMDRLEVDLLIVTSLPNIRYLAGFTGSDGALVMTKSRGTLLVDGRYVTQAGEQVSLHEVECYKSKSEAIRSHLAGSGGKRVAFEAEWMTVSLHAAIFAGEPGITGVPLAAELDELRQCKDSAEIEILSRCATIASEAVEHVLQQPVSGKSELQLALDVEIVMKRAGAEGYAFDFIVASGIRGALPHGRASDKVIRVGELVTIDFGAVYNGYFSDETVTIAVGPPDARQQEIYSIVKEAHDLAVAAIRPGVPLADLDAVARCHIDKCGYGEYFTHGLGHGVGLEIHEKPVVNGKSATFAAEGMVFTIEPGIYIPGWGGVRIEDTVVVTADGCRLLTKVNKELFVAA